LAGCSDMVVAVIGALVFGRMADVCGRKKLFLVTLAVYMLATLATGFSTETWFFLLCRFATGLGIGGEYAAINSAIDELMPARVRGRVSLAINGSFWLGAALGAGLSLLVLDEALIPVEWGWRLGVILGAVLAIAIALVRRDVPESPRWLLTHGRIQAAEDIVADIERRVHRQYGTLPAVPVAAGVSMGWRAPPRLAEIMHVLLHTYRRRSVVALALMV